MNHRDAISENDLYPAGTLTPVYYCEACGDEMGYPSGSGMCWPCELEREQPSEDEE